MAFLLLRAEGKKIIAAEKVIKFLFFIIFITIFLFDDLSLKEGSCRNNESSISPVKISFEILTTNVDLIKRRSRRKHKEINNFFASSLERILKMKRNYIITQSFLLQHVEEVSGDGTMKVKLLDDFLVSKWFAMLPWVGEHLSTWRQRHGDTDKWQHNCAALLWLSNYICRSFM